MENDIFCSGFIVLRPYPLQIALRACITPPTSGGLVEGARFPEADLKIGVSGGIATFPDDGTDLDMLLAVADERMYKTKK